MAAPVFRFRLVDFSRGIAALIVAAVHWKRFMVEYPWGTYSAGGLIEPLARHLGPLYEYGPLAVQFFWLISGFIFAHVYGATKIGFLGFAGRRIARLIPLHLLTLFMVAALQIGFVLLIGTTLFYTADAYHFVLNLLFIPSFGLESGLSFNGPIWSVAVELPIYAFFWLTVARLRLNAVIALGISAVFFLLQDVTTFTQVDYCGLMFFVGSAIYYASEWFKPALLAILAAAGWAIGIAAALLMPWVGEAITLVTVIAFGPVLALLGAADRILGERPGIWDRFAAFGDLSYSIYLLHVPLIMAITMAMILLGIDRGILSGNVAAMVVFLVATVAISHISLKSFENPARHWLRTKFASGPDRGRRNLRLPGTAPPRRGQPKPGDV